MTPMARFPIVSTRDPEEAEAILSRELTDVRFQKVRSPNRFGFEMNGVHLGDTLVAFNQFDTDTILDGGQLEESIVVSVGVGAPMTSYIDGKPVSYTESAAIFAPPRKGIHHRPAGGGEFTLQIGYAELERRLRTALDRNTNEPIQFDIGVDLRSSLGLHLRSLIGQLVDCAACDDPILSSPLLRSTYDDLVANTLLSLPNNYTEELNGGREVPVAPAIVHRAEAFLEAHASEHVTIEQLLTECGCSRRGLFDAFRRNRQYTPMQFLKDRRLELAREALQLASPGATVSSIAYTCGFSHPSRFASAYLQRFGELPSQTLRDGASNEVSFGLSSP